MILITIRDKGEFAMSSAFTRGVLVENDSKQAGSILAFTIAKGGQLKSTSVINIAGAIIKDCSIEKAKICILDIDAQANVFTSFGLDADMLDEHEDLSGAMLGFTTIEGENITGLAAIENSVFELYRENNDKYIHCITANERCDLLEMTILTNLDIYTNPTTLLRDMCKELSKYYTHIIIDTPPAYSLMVSNVFMIDGVEVYVPFEPETYALRSVAKTIATFDSFSVKNPSAVFGGVFATKVKTNTNIHASIIGTARTYTQSSKKRYLKTFIPNSVKAANAVYYEALPPILSSKKSDQVKEYFDLWEEIK